MLRATLARQCQHVSQLAVVARSCGFWAQIRPFHLPDQPRRNPNPIPIAQDRSFDDGVDAQRTADFSEGLFRAFESSMTDPRETPLHSSDLGEISDQSFRHASRKNILRLVKPERFSSGRTAMASDLVRPGDESRLALLQPDCSRRYSLASSGDLFQASPGCRFHR